MTNEYRKQRFSVEKTESYRETSSRYKENSQMCASSTDGLGKKITMLQYDSRRVSLSEHYSSDFKGEYP